MLVVVGMAVASRGFCWVTEQCCRRCRELVQTGRAITGHSRPVARVFLNHFIIRQSIPPFPRQQLHRTVDPRPSRLQIH